MTLFIVSKAEHDSANDSYQNFPIEAYSNHDSARIRCVELEKEISQYVYHYYFVTEVELVK